jgi:hypothetical protein
VADGQDTPSGRRASRPAVPHTDGPLGSSGAAPLDHTASPVTSGPAATADPDPAAATTPKAPATVPAQAHAPATATVSAPTSPAETSTATAAGPASATVTGADVKPGTDVKPDGVGAKDGVGVPEAAAAPVVAAPGVKSPGKLRRIRPIRAARAAGRTTVDWARKPNGRLILPAVLAVLLVGGAGAAGAYLVPRALEAVPAPSTSPQLLPQESAGVLPGAVPSFPVESFPPVEPTGAVGQTIAGARPADALAGWAQQVGTRVGIPVVAVQAYGYAELVLTRTKPSCHLSWTTLAAIAKVESAHGSANGAVLGVDGQALPAIVGLPLDGKGGRQLIQDTDGGALDGDRTFDRAMGPLQFIPTTWRENAIDADNNGVTDPNDIDDASLAAGSYLCAGGRDLAKPEDWWEAILSYNDVRPYAQKVFTEANAYGQRSRT